MMPTIKKLIEVALPLEAINAESAREKIHSPRPSQHAASMVGTATPGHGSRRHLVIAGG